MIWLRKLANKDLKLICSIKSKAKLSNSGTSLHFPFENKISPNDQRIRKRNDPVLILIKELLYSLIEISKASFVWGRIARYWRARPVQHQVNYRACSLMKNIHVDWKAGSLHGSPLTIDTDLRKRIRNRKYVMTRDA